MRFGLLTAVLTASVLSCAAHAAIVEEFKAEDWDGTAFTDDATGQFSHCAVYASYRNGSTLYLSYEASESWYFSVANDSWSLTEGGNFAIKFKVDRRGEIEGTGVALANNQIGLPVEADHPFVSQLRRGNQLTISFQNQDYFFELSNSNRAMNAAQDCVRRHVAAGTRTPVMSRMPDERAAPDPAPSPDATPEPGENASTDTSEDNAAVATGDQQTFGPWVVMATDDGAGNFVNCTAYGVHGDDQLILSYFSDNVWTFGLYRTAWNLDTNQAYYLWYNVDGPADAHGVTKRPVEAPESTRIFFEVSDLEDIVERIEAGKTLNIQFRGLIGEAENYSYPLDQAAEAFAATKQCVSDHASSEAVSKDGTGTKGGETSTAPEEEATEGSTRSGDTTETHQELPALGLTLVEEFDVPGWKAAAFSLDDGAFTHCGIKAEYQNGATLGVARTAGGDYLLAIQHGDWRLEPTTWVPISYSVTGGTSLSAAQDGQAVDANLILANMGGEELTDTLKAATAMTIEAEGTSLSFDVSDIGPGIEAIDACVVRNTEDTTPVAAPAAKKAGGAPEPESEPETDVASVDAAEPEEPAQGTLPSRDVASVEAPAASMDVRTEAAGYTTALLFRSGYPNHVILGVDASIPNEVPPGDATWELGGVIGSTRIANSGTPSDIERDVIVSMADKCNGALATWPVTSDATHSQFTLVCAGAAPWTTQVVVVPRDAGGSYLFAMSGKGDDIAEELIATAVYAKALGG